MVRTIDHVGVAVRDLEAAIANYAAALGLAPGPIEELPARGVRVCRLGTGESRVELIAPLDASSPVARFLERSGPGLHHLAFAVDDLDAERARMVSAGLEPIGEPSRGADGKRIQFFHPRTTGGVLLEICAEAR